MKAILCGATGEVEVFSFGTSWTSCPCGNVRAKWIDPTRGTVVVAARDQDAVRLLGMHNHVLVSAFETRGQMWEDFRIWHQHATHSPGYIFDQSKAGCWAVIARIGSTDDVRWATPSEFEDAFRPLVVHPK